MLSLTVLLLVLAVPGAIAGAITGLLVAHFSNATKGTAQSAAPAMEEPLDPFVSAEIDRAAVRYVSTYGLRPEATGIIASKLRLLQRLGLRREERP